MLMYYETQSRKFNIAPKLPNNSQSTKKLMYYETQSRKFKSCHLILQSH